MKGSVRPTTGSTNRHIPTLETIWNTSIPATPTQMYASSWLLALRATTIQRITMAASSASVSTQPSIPNSSPMTAKMKSVCRKGRFTEEVLWV